LSRKAMRRIMFKSPMCITPLLPIAHRAGDRVTWLSSQWKLSLTWLTSAWKLTGIV